MWSLVKPLEDSRVDVEGDGHCILCPQWLVWFLQ